MDAITQQRHSQHRHPGNAILLWAAIGTAVALIGLASGCVASGANQRNVRIGRDLWIGAGSHSVAIRDGGAGVDSGADESERPRAFAGQVTPFHLDTEIDDNTADAIVGYLASHPGPAAVVINSPGGSVMAAYDIMAAIERHGQVMCLVDGMAASAAFAILQSCQVRGMTARSFGMAHDASIGGLIGGQSTLFRNIAERLRVVSEAMAHQVCRRATMPYASCRSLFANGKEHWVTAQEALAQGFADAVL